jgi:hypothetical protein
LFNLLFNLFKLVQTISQVTPPGITFTTSELLPGVSATLLGKAKRLVSIVHRVPLDRNTSTIFEDALASFTFRVRHSAPCVVCGKWLYMCTCSYCSYCSLLGVTWWNLVELGGTWWNLV